MKTYTNFELFDFCLPDYFSGYHLPVLAIPVYSTLKNKDVVNDLKNELNSCFDMYEELLTPENEKVFNAYCDKLMSKKNEIFVKQKRLPEDCDPAYLYFSFCSPVQRYGMTFLNE